MKVKIKEIEIVFSESESGTNKSLNKQTNNVEYLSTGMEWVMYVLPMAEVKMWKWKSSELLEKFKKKTSEMGV